MCCLARIKTIESYLNAVFAVFAKMCKDDEES